MSKVHIGRKEEKQAKLSYIVNISIQETCAVQSFLDFPVARETARSDDEVFFFRFARKHGSNSSGEKSGGERLGNGFETY